jgi:hypothetical protein
MDSLGVIYKPGTVCPFPVVSIKPLQSDSVPFGSSASPVSLVGSNDSCNDSLYVLHRTLILASILNWTFRGLHIVPGALHPTITSDAHPGRIAPNGRSSVSAIHNLTSCRTYWPSSLLFLPISFIYWYIGLYSSFPVIFSNFSCIIHCISCYFGRPVNRPSYRSLYVEIFKCRYIKC